LIDNETLAYFMCRTYLFLTEAGINPNNLRFRQHLSNEMAHYAKDCWDAEIETSHGWVECVGKYRLLKGHADRAAFDLCAHTKESKI
jgi:glycyl-tRNA synthetase